jgi:putative MATE family efflux protein
MSADRARARILQGSIPVELAKFGLPIAIGMGLQTTFNLVDAYVIARLSPDVAGPSLGALGIADQLTACGTILSYGLTTASTAMIARAHGRGDEAAVRRLTWQSCLVVALMSVIFGGGFLSFAGPILEGVVGVKGAVAEVGVSYLRINGGGAFSIFFLLQLTAIARALGSAKTPVALLVLSNILNLFLSVVFVYGPGEAPDIFSWGPPIAAAIGCPRMELDGAAWSSIVARSVALVPVVLLLLRRFRVFDRAAMTRPDGKVWRTMWGVAWPSSTELVVRMLAMLLTQSLVARAFTTETDQTANTALGIVFRLETMALFVSMGWGSASQTFIGQNLGAGHDRRAVASGWWAAAYGVAFMLAIAAAYSAFGEPVIAFFDSTPAVVGTAMSYIAIVAWSYVGLGAGVILGNAIAGAGATRTALLTDLGVIVGFQVPACVLAVLLPGAELTTLWKAVAITYVVSGVTFLAVYRFVPWIKSAKNLAMDEDAAALPLVPAPDSAPR